MLKKTGMLISVFLSVFLANCTNDTIASFACNLADNGLLLTLPSTSTNGASFESVSFDDYCRDDILGPDSGTNLGNSDSWPDNGSSEYAAIGKNRKWREAWGAALRTNAVSPTGNNRPYFKQAEYKRVSGCGLEMRVYKRDINQTDLKPMMLIHGGGWEFRSLGFIGAEGLVSHYTDRGYAVFMPFYRLINRADGPRACQNWAGPEISQDIDDAFAWMKQHGELLGADMSQPVTMVGQSAGANLAGWLSLQRPSEFDKVVLFYPPVAFRSFLDLLQQGEYDGRFRDALSSIASYSGNPAFASLDIDNLPEFMLDNSLPYRISTGATHPKYFIMHGNADTRVPVEQSTYTCAALAGLALDQASSEGGDYLCGQGHEMVIVEGGNHSFDLRCLLDIVPGFFRDLVARDHMDELCPTSMELLPGASQAVQRSIDWLDQ